LPAVPTNLISFKYNLFNDSAENILRLYGAEYFQTGSYPGDTAYPSGYTISSYFPFNGGSASAMDDLPPSSVAVANNMPMPVFRFANLAGNTVQFTNWVQAQITNTLPKISTVHNFLTNNGVTTVCFIDAYWDAAHRDSGGGIVWDTNQFPSGMPWVASWLHTNGWNLELANYYLGGYSNEVSGTIEGGSENYVAITANTIQRDIARIHSWGVDGFRAEDSSLSSGYQQQMMLQLSAACVAPGGSVFNDIVNQPYPHPMYSDVILQNPPNPNWSSWVNDVSSDYIAYLPPASQTLPFQIDMWNFRVDYTNYVPDTSRGHYSQVFTFSGGGADPAIGDAHIFLSSAAMTFSSLDFWGATNDSIAASFSNSVLSNTKWISVWHDPMFAHVQKVYDGGILTTSVWSRALSTGGSAVLMVNETNTQPMSVQFSALGMSPALTTFDVFDCWSNQDLGNFNGGFTNSIPMQDCGLYVVTPVSTGGGGGSSALPASTNSIWNLTNTANTFSGNGGGLTNIYVSSLVISTNAAPQTNTIVGFFWLTNGVNVYKIPVLQ
jgi:alpha-galactosidase